jgi:hypothetical protein
MISRNSIVACLSLLVFGWTNQALGMDPHSGLRDFSSYEWTEVNPDADWTPRAGLQVLNRWGSFYLMGGRTPNPPSFPPVIGDSVIWGDVWRSDDQGGSWKQIVQSGDAWPPRAYFQAVTKGPFMYVLGGQNFKAGAECPPGVPNCSDFFNDVWRSLDGVHWKQMTADAGWEGRAGLSAVVFNHYIYVMGGSQNDDEAIGGPGTRRYFNDVWRSRDGRHWEQVTANAPWLPRAGAVTVVQKGYLYLLGGEEGFICAPQPCDPPYFNDVWRTKDGVQWEPVTAAAGWSPRPGHQCAVVASRIVCFGGFGLSNDPTDPFAPGNPLDVWVSETGADWEQVSESPWNATDPAEGKYDFDVIAGWFWGEEGYRPSIFTFGGDRETFDFADPTNFLNVDNDVWRFAPPLDSRRVTIVIKPGADQNCIKINGRGTIPVAILGSAKFDVLQIDRTSLSFAGLGVREDRKDRLRCRKKDTNIDGYWDLVCRFEDDKAKWAPDSETEATLTGNLLDGNAFEGTSSFCLRPEKGADKSEVPTELEQAHKQPSSSKEDDLNPLPWWAW